MSEQEFNKIFSSNLNYYLEKYEKTQAELAKYVGVSTASVSNWCKGLKNPRMDKVDKMCEFFHIKRSDLMKDKHEVAEESDSSYYLNDETREIAQAVFENPDLKSLFDMSRKMPPERLKAHLEFIKKMQDMEK